MQETLETKARRRRQFSIGNSQIIEQYDLHGDECHLHLKSSTDTLQSSVIEGFQIDIATLFDLELNA